VILLSLLPSCFPSHFPCPCSFGSSCKQVPYSTHDPSLADSAIEAAVKYKATKVQVFVFRDLRRFGGTCCASYHRHTPIFKDYVFYNLNLPSAGGVAIERGVDVHEIGAATDNEIKDGLTERRRDTWPKGKHQGTVLGEQVWLACPMSEFQPFTEEECGRLDDLC
jgi:hypothetical protein